MINLIPDENLKIVLNFFKTMTVKREIPFTPSNVTLTSIESRMNTFNQCHIDLFQNVRKLCEAGFYYIGKICSYVLYYKSMQLDLIQLN